MLNDAKAKESFASGRLTRNSSDLIPWYTPIDCSRAESIKDIKIINENNLLFVISDNDQIYLIIYSLDKKQIISKIGK